MNNTQLIEDFIATKTLAVIASAAAGQTPQSAVIEFVSDKLELIFDCFNTSRKYQNIQKNPHVSLVIGWEDDITVQYEGVAKEIKGMELKESKKTFYHKLPDAMKFEKYPQLRFFRVKPTWIRYSDLNKKPWEVFEIKM